MSPGSVFGFDRMTVATPSEDASQESSEIVDALRAGTTPEVLGLFDELRNPPKRSWLTQVGVLAVSLFLFLTLGLLHWSPAEIALLVVVLVFHEGGHFAAMRAFGYRDVRVFFIPLFGAAVSGSPAAVPGYQRTLVALAGPVPGILLGLVLVLVYALGHSSMVGEAAKMFLGINAFNLLPLLPLDGGRVLEETLFCRSRWAEAVFRAGAALAMLLLAYSAGDFTFGLLGIFMLGSVSFTFRVNGVAAALRKEAAPPDLREPSRVTLAFLQRVSDAVEAAFPQRLKASQAVSVVRSVLDKLSVRPPGRAATAGLLATHGAALVLAFIGGVAFFAAQSYGGVAGRPVVKEGECWSYATRSGEEQSFLVIRKIETLPEVGEVIHVSVFNLKIKTPRAPEAVITHVSHVPYAGPVLRGSLTRRIDRAVPPTEWEESYRVWRQAFEEDRGGVHMVSVRQSVDDLEAIMGRVQRGQ